VIVYPYVTNQKLTAGTVSGLLPTSYSLKLKEKHTMPEIKPYCEEISRSNPSCIVFLIDQSGSMAEQFGGLVEDVTNPIKSQGAADALNRCLANIAKRCTKQEGIRNWLDMGIWSYGASVGPALQKHFPGRELSRLPKVLSQTCGDPLKSSINTRSSTIMAISDSSRRRT
jgi:hypothetical protein